MTIKDFARLCGCNPQTLRYYDHMDLLKPVQVDQWSGFRCYEEEQALTFVKIKNLQKAGFTIQEIKGLLDQDSEAILRAFEVKIAEEEKKLQEIKAIQRSYQDEMNQIQEKIKEVREKVVKSMLAYDPRDEFGISAQQYDAIIGQVNQFFENLTQHVPKDIGYHEFDDEDAPEEEKDYLELLSNPEFTVLYEKHGWARVKDFFGEFSELEDGAEYALIFRVDQAKGVYNQAFANTILGLLLASSPQKKNSLSCNVEDSLDGQNHFWLLKRN